MSTLFYVDYMHQKRMSIDIHHHHLTSLEDRSGGFFFLEYVVLGAPGRRDDLILDSNLTYILLSKVSNIKNLVRKLIFANNFYQIDHEDIMILRNQDFSLDL